MRDFGRPVLAIVLGAIVVHFLSFYGKTIQGWLVVSLASQKHTELYANTLLILLILTIALVSYCIPFYNKNSKRNKRMREFWNNLPYCYDKLMKMKNGDFEKMIGDAKKDQLNKTVDILESIKKEDEKWKNI